MCAISSIDADFAELISSGFSRVSSRPVLRSLIRLIVYFCEQSASIFKRTAPRPIGLPCTKQTACNLFRRDPRGRMAALTTETVRTVPITKTRFGRVPARPIKMNFAGVVYSRVQCPPLVEHLTGWSPYCIKTSIYLAAGTLTMTKRRYHSFYKHRPCHACFTRSQSFRVMFTSNLSSPSLSLSVGPRYHCQKQIKTSIIYIASLNRQSVR